MEDYHSGQCGEFVLLSVVEESTLEVEHVQNQLRLMVELHVQDFYMSHKHVIFKHVVHLLLQQLLLLRQLQQ